MREEPLLRGRFGETLLVPLGVLHEVDARVVEPIQVVQTYAAVPLVAFILRELLRPVELLEGALEVALPQEGGARTTGPLDLPFYII